MGSFRRLGIRDARLLLLGLALTAAPAWSAGPAITVRVTEGAGVARRAAPVTVGVPFRPGMLRDGAAVTLADAGGRPLPIQTAVLERWLDGTVRWLLVDFLADVAARREATYAIRPGAGSPPAGAAIRIEPGAGGDVVDSGPLRFVVPSSGGALARDLALPAGVAARAIPLPALVTAAGDAATPAAQPPSFETRGPIRSEVLFTGRWPDGAAYEARLAAFAGQPALRLRYTLTHLGDAPTLGVRRLGVSLSADLRRGAIGGRGFAGLERPHALRITDASDARLDGAPISAPPDCWISGAAAATVALIVTPSCWEQHPQLLGVSPGGLQVDWMAGGDDPVALGRGAAKTHEAWIAFQPAAEAGSAAETAAALASPLVAHVDPQWVVATGALGGALAPDDPGAASFLNRLREAFRRYRARAGAERWDDGPPVDCDARPGERPRTGFYGALHWGDWNFPGYRDRMKGCDAWGNLEYDLTQVLGLGFVATGSLAMWDGFQAAARHYRDVDIIHHDPEHPDRVGLNHPHKMGHFSPQAVQNVDLGHAWLEGLITHHRLTGERRSLEAARAMGDTLAARIRKAGNPRQFGWPMLALAALADATGEPRYREAAAAFAEPALAAYEPTPASGDWKVGILADGLAAVQAVTPAAPRLDWLRRYADALVAAPPDRFADARYALPLGVLAAWTGNPRYRERALGVAAGLDVGDWGKALALGGRTGFRLLGPLAAPPGGHPVVTPAPGAPRPPSAPAPQPR